MRRSDLGWLARCRKNRQELVLTASIPGRFSAGGHRPDSCVDFDTAFSRMVVHASTPMLLTQLAKVRDSARTQVHSLAPQVP